MIDWWYIAFVLALVAIVSIYLSRMSVKPDRKIDQFFSTHKELFDQGQGWSLILGFIQQLSGRYASTKAIDQVVNKMIRKITAGSPLWESTPDIILSPNPEALSGVTDGPLREIFLRNLSLGCIEHNIGGPQLMAIAIKLNQPISRISRASIKKAAGYGEYLKYALVNGISKTYWPDNERPETDEMLLWLLNNDPGMIQELPDLLTKIRKKYRAHYPDLIHPDMGEIASLACNLMSDPPEQVAAVFGKKYVEILSRIREIPLSDDIVLPACTVHHRRPMIRHGHIACPVCFEAADLTGGVRIIVGTIGDVLPPEEGVLLVSLSLPLKPEHLTGLEEIRIGSHEGYSPDAILDQTLAIAEQLSHPIPVQCHTLNSLSAGHQAMLREWNLRAARKAGDSV